MSFTISTHTGISPNDEGGWKNRRPIMLSDSNAQNADDDQTVESIGAVGGITEEGWGDLIRGPKEKRTAINQKVAHG